MPWVPGPDTSRRLSFWHSTTVKSYLNYFEVWFEWKLGHSIAAGAGNDLKLARQLQREEDRIIRGITRHFFFVLFLVQINFSNLRPSTNHSFWIFFLFFCTCLLHIFATLVAYPRSRTLEEPGLQLAPRPRQRLVGRPLAVDVLLEASAVTSVNPWSQEPEEHLL